ncbi:MAG: glycosyltransferase family 4 protein [Actinomycetota bacterium]|nr:glycosyltransferase family 4 protein [Actinomycetota bacterium]|tara:strand:- start:5573 stop:6853 length:1281 start_codon:yes stop_codon:yes gene_type:complete
MPNSANSTVDSDRRLRIAYLSYRGKPHCGGQGIYTRHLTKALTDLGHSVVVLSGQPYPELDERVELVRLPSLDIFNDHFPMRKPRIWELKTKWDFVEVASFNTGNFSEPLSFSLRAWEYLKSRRDEFDLVHDNQCLGWGLTLLQKAGFPLLSTIHHPITVDRRLEIAHSRTLFESFSKRRWYAFTKMQTRVAKRMHRVMTVSESSKVDISADHKVDPERIHVVPVGVDPEIFAPVQGVQRKPGMILTTASADVAMKGLKYLLEAIAKLKTERDVELVIIGKPSEGSSSTDVIDELGLTDCVSWVHGVSDDRIVELYSEAEIAVVPSLYEGFSLPAIEAMSCGVPLVTTTGGALPEVAGPHNETCFQVPPGDSEALASMIGKVLDNPEDQARVGENGRRRVIENWSWHHTALRTVEQYRSLLSESKG